MKSRYKIAAAVIGSFVVGLGAASILHAQTKAPGYVIAEIDIKDQDGYTKDFLPKAQANIKEFGGKYIGGGKAIGFAGAPPANRVVLLQFPDMDTVKAFEEKEGRTANEVGSRFGGAGGAPWQTGRYGATGLASSHPALPWRPTLDWSF